MAWLKNFFGKVFGHSEQTDLEQADLEQINSELVTLKDNNQSSEQLEIIEENNNPVDEEYFLELEEKFLSLDCGIEFAEYIVEKAKAKGNLTISECEKYINKLCTEVLQNANLNNEYNFNEKKIILIVGVNGAGKTTSIGKLAKQYTQRGKKVLIAPCDTFRAAASGQLQMWAQRAEADFYASPNAQKADAILYEALKETQQKNYDILIVDTAGRLQNKKSLMDELAKLSSVIDKHAESEIKVERLLVLDANTGQNGYQQAVLFNETANLNGIILSKFDSSAKGGIVFAISHNLGLPIKFIGTGEKIDDLKQFVTGDFTKEVL